MSPPRRLLLFATILLLSPEAGRAWGPVGHKAVAILAQSRLKPETLAAIRNLVGKRIDLDWIASCADIFGHGNGHMVCAGAITVDGDAEASRPWHYINIPISEHPTAASLGRYCKGNTDCVSAQIREDVRTLQDPAASRQAKQAALMFLVHFVGDAHQPLHCADDNDGGGNQKTTNVIMRGTKTLNLHQIWDHAVDNPGEEDDVLLFQDVSAEARTLASVLAQELKETQAGASDALRSWTQGDDLPEQIALESFQVAQDAIYPQYRRDRGRIADPADPRRIGKDYHDRMRPIAHQRLEMAGVRLAYLLELAFSAPHLGVDGKPVLFNIPRLDLPRYSDPFRR